MIFVTVGTREPFDRLLLALSASPTDEDLVVQHGTSVTRLAGATNVDFLPYDEVVAYVRAARVVVTHAGVGSVLTALAHGRRPIVMPRSRSSGDAVDDHQQPFAERLAGAGLITLVHGPADLGDAIRRAGATDVPSRELDGALAAELRDLLGAWLGPQPSGADNLHAQR